MLTLVGAHPRYHYYTMITFSLLFAFAVGNNDFCKSEFRVRPCVVIARSYPLRQSVDYAIASKAECGCCSQYNADGREIACVFLLHGSCTSAAMIIVVPNACLDQSEIFVSSTRFHSANSALMQVIF